MRPILLPAACALTSLVLALLGQLLPADPQQAWQNTMGVNIVQKKLQQQQQLSVLTLNAWGLWLVSRRRQDRMVALADFLRSDNCTADVVLLQEMWVLQDVQLVTRAAAQGGLPHSFHYQSGAIGSGLLLLSRHPIVDVAFHSYSARGDPAALLNGDFLAGKGVGWAALQTPAGLVSVFTTHLSANYGQQWETGVQGLPPGCRVPRDKYAGVRMLQVLELAAFVRARSAGSVATVLGGDLNAAPDTLEVAVLKALLPELRDAWAEVRPEEPGPTANAPQSSFTTVGAGHRPIRIDYVWSTVRPLSADLALTDTGRGFSYSDHLGLAASLSLGSSGRGSGSSSARSRSKSRGRHGRLAGGATEAGALLGASVSQAAQRQPALFQHATAACKSAAAAMGQGRQQFMLLACGLWAGGLVCLLALLMRWQRGMWPTGADPLLLAGVAGAFGWAGVLFLTGFVARSMEMQALQQAAWQLQLAVELAGSTAVA